MFGATRLWTSEIWILSNFVNFIRPIDRSKITFATAQFLVVVIKKKTKCTNQITILLIQLTGAGSRLLVTRQVCGLFIPYSYTSYSEWMNHLEVRGRRPKCIDVRAPCGCVCVSAHSERRQRENHTKE